MAKLQKQAVVMRAHEQSVYSCRARLQELGTVLVGPPQLPQLPQPLQRSVLTQPLTCWKAQPADRGS